VTSPPQDTRTTRDYWDAERKASARPMPMPVPETTDAPSAAPLDAVQPSDPPTEVGGGGPADASAGPGAAWRAP